MDLLQAALLLCWGLMCAHGQQRPSVRLIGGPSACSGYLQVWHNNQWGYVCRDKWSPNNAAVVCQELWCGHAMTYTEEDQFNRLNGVFVLDEVQCVGNEASLLQCPSEGLGHHNCKLFEEVRVKCSEPAQLRLSGGGSACEGRVEVYRAGSWGAVCGRGSNATRLLCKELGCGDPLQERPDFGPALARVWMDSLSCEGDEAFLWQCAYTRGPLERCSGSQDAWAAVCTGHKELRLEGDRRACSGWLQVKEDPVFSDVCPDRWTPEAGKVACRQLGCGEWQPSVIQESRPRSKTTWGPTSSYTGNETSLWEDVKALAGTKQCSSTRALHINCSGNVMVKLATDGVCAGRVEVFHDERWGAVCHQGSAPWSTENAKVVCRETGCGEFAFFPTSAHGPASRLPFVMSDVNCTRNESFLWHCGFNRHTCSSGREALVACSKALTVRLVDGGSHCAGRAEVRYLGQWGTVCSTNLDSSVANVVCKELGCGQMWETSNDAYFGEGKDQIWLKNVQCPPNAEFLWQCNLNFDSTGCQHSKDVSIICQGHKALTLLEKPCSGHVRVMINNVLMQVAWTDDWNTSTADVLCHQLHCGDARAASDSDPVDDMDSTTQAFSCQGNESSLSECDFFPDIVATTTADPTTVTPWTMSAENQTDEEDEDYNNVEVSTIMPEGAFHKRTLRSTVVNCSEHLELQLQDGGDRCSGRVELFYRGIWGNVCGTNWDRTAAQLVCQQLGCGSVVDLMSTRLLNASTGLAWLHVLHCKPTTLHLWHCSTRPPKHEACLKGTHTEVICSASLKVRLVNGHSRCSGTAEVFFKYMWTKVCFSNNWSQDAESVCKALGCGAMVKSADGEYAPHGAKWINRIHCEDGWSQKGCVLKNVTDVDCSGGRAAMVMCSDNTQLQLTGDDEPCSGRVMIYPSWINSTGGWTDWKALSAEGWNRSAAQVVCRQLHCGDVMSFNTSKAQTPLWNKVYHCTGNESSLWDCPSVTSSKALMRVATINCSERIAVRLSGTNYSCAGLVELRSQGEWSMVCNQYKAQFWKGKAHFGEQICKVANCSTFVGAEVKSVTASRKMWTNYLHCDDSARHPWHCLTSAPERGSCPAKEEEAAAVAVCSDSLQFRLMGGYSRCDGRLEIFYNGQWGTACNTKTWDNNSAQIVCAMLSCGWAQRSSHSSIGEDSRLPVVLRVTECNARLTKLWQCEAEWGRVQCEEKTPASLVCSGGVDPETRKIHIPTILSAVLVPLLLLALGIVLWCWLSTKKRAYLRRNKEKIYDEIGSDNVFNGAKGGLPMTKLDYLGETMHPPGQAESPHEQDDGVNSDPDYERYDDAELVLPISSTAGAPGATETLLPSLRAESLAQDPEETHREFEAITLVP